MHQSFERADLEHRSEFRDLIVKKALLFLKRKRWSTALVVLRRFHIDCLAPSAKASIRRCVSVAIR